MLSKELHQLKYEAISVPLGSVHLVKKTQERKSSTCYLLITKGSRVRAQYHKDPPCRGEMHDKSVESSNVLLLEWCGS
ncbi:hypothetical protein TNCV_3247621 [Trichonephila clavipes]|nr:hypothetical protein TNCV_3247621 [Trichonephila clavipes]